MKYIQILIFIVMLIIIAQPMQAQVGLNKVAQSTMNFQLVGISPKASAMGDAFMALGKGAESIFFNPAGIAEMSHRFDVKMYATQWISDINYMAGAAVWNGNKFGAIGVSLLWVDYGTIHGTSLVPLAEQSLYPRGYIDNGAVSNVGAYSFGISYGLAVSTQFHIGANMRLVGQNLGQNYFATGEVIDNNAAKLVFDAGVKYYTGFKSFRFGMAIRNFSSNLKREEISEQMPLLFTMGAAMDLFDVLAPVYSENNSLTLAIDFQHPNNFSERASFGLEYRFWEKLALRGGYLTNHDLASWSVGAGFQSSLAGNDFEFDYSYSNLKVFDAVNRFSIGVAF